MEKNNADRKTKLRILLFSSILCALSVILGQYASIKVGTSIRIGFGSLPVIMAGCLFGPYVGLAVGFVGDFVGCAVYYGLGEMIPLVTLGSMAEGFLAGLLGRKMTVLSISVATAVSHAVGSLALRTLGLWLRYKTPLETLVFRIPIVIIEIVLIIIVLVALFCTNSAVKKAVRGLYKK